MTTTRAMLRTMVRRRLADTSADPLWEDAFLDDAIAEAVRRYGDRVPREASASATVVAGSRSVAIPAGVTSSRIERVFDDTGELWPRWSGSLAVVAPAPSGPARGARLWRLWGNDLILGAPVPRSAVWRLEFLADRALPTDDATVLDAESGDEDILIALAMQVALARRAIADGTRHLGAGQGVHPLMGAARMAQADAEKLFWLRRRRVRGSTLVSQETGT
ncbi:MAG: phage adaptor protein [Thermomicrobiales bacterium]